MSDRHIYLGRTAEGASVECDIILHQPAGTATFTDHSQRPRPVRLAISWTVGYDHFGQVPAADRVVATRAKGVSQALIDTLNRLWTEHHLNDMHAECDHMTEDMLNPSDDALETWLNEESAEHHREYTGRNGQLSAWRIHHVVCPVTGYRYGRKWLAREVPEHDLALASAIILTGSVPA